MSSVGRGILAVIAGFIGASVVMMIVESINGHVLYPELGRMAQGVTDREQIRTLMAGAPLGAFLVVLLGWILGGLAGGFIAARIGRKPASHAPILGVLLTLAGVANNLMVPPPAWFWIVSLLVFLPATLAGARLVPARGRAAG